MTERAALVAAIEADPDNDLPRLVFADWLDDHASDHNRLRAELIRVQCEAAVRPSDVLTERQRELLDGLSQTWPANSLGEWQPSDLLPDERGPFDQYRPHFLRGFLTHLMPDATEFVVCVEKYHAAGEPVLDLILWHWPRESLADDSWLAPLIASPHLRLAGSVGGRVPAEVFGSPHLSRLSVAVLNTVTAVQGLLDSPSSFTLRRLSLLPSESPQDPYTLAWLLAHSPRLATLESLSLDVPGFNDRCWRVLANSPHLPPTLALKPAGTTRLPYRRSAVGRMIRARFPGPPAVG